LRRRNPPPIAALPLPPPLISTCKGAADGADGTPRCAAKVESVGALRREDGLGVAHAGEADDGAPAAGHAHRHSHHRGCHGNMEANAMAPP
jgi:hypothetical protein